MFGFGDQNSLSPQSMAQAMPQGTAVPQIYQQPQGVWGQLTGQGNPVGFAGNPLFQMGLGMMARGGSGDSFSGLGEDYAKAMQAQQVGRRNQIADFQFKDAMEAKQRKDQQRAKLQEMVSDNPQLAPYAGTGLEGVAATEMLKNQLAPKGNEWGMSDGQIYSKRTGELKDPENAGRWSEKRLAAEFDLSKVPPRAYQEAVNQGSPLPIIQAMQAGGGGGAMDGKDIMRVATDINATPESIKAAMAGKDVTLLQERDPLDTPANRTDINAYMDDAEKQLGTYSRAAEVLQQQVMSITKPNSMADLMSVYNFIKTLDPTSVVREGEIGLFDAAKSYVTRAKALVQKQGEKGFLTPVEKGNLSELLGGMQKVSQQGYERTRSRMGRRADALGMGDRVTAALPTVVYPEKGIWDKITADFRGQPDPNTATVPAAPAGAAAAAFGIPQEVWDSVPDLPPK